MSKTLAEEVAPLVHAGFAGLHVRSWEPERAVEELATLCRSQHWELVLWDVDVGLSWPQEPSKPSPENSDNPVRGIKALHDTHPENDMPRLLILVNFHRFLDNSKVAQATANAVVRGKGRRCVYLLVGAPVSLPPELEKLFTTVDHLLPGPGQLRKLAEELACGPLEDNPTPYQEEEIASKVPALAVEAARGLTRREAEDAFALSLYEHGKLEPEVVWDLKAKSLSGSRALTVHRGGAGFDSLGGLANLKGFSKLLLRPENTVPTKGLMLLGVPGTGKSAFCKALGAEVGRPVLLLDVGACFGKYIGETESSIRGALAAADAMGKVILMLDEVEKGLSGQGGEVDNGTATRLFGTLLTWLSDREERGSDVFVVCTSNDVTRLPPEFTRAERFDACFFLDLPTKEERSGIWKMYGEQFKLSHSQQYGEEGFSDEGWTGAEVRACCRLAKALDTNVLAASKNVVPVSRTAACKIDELRKWASGRCLSASQPGIYLAGAEGSSTKLTESVVKTRRITGKNKEIQ